MDETELRVSDGWNKDGNVFLVRGTQDRIWVTEALANLPCELVRREALSLFFSSYFVVHFGELIIQLHVILIGHEYVVNTEDVVLEEFAVVGNPATFVVVSVH